jgi:DNA-binding response OmpR family regulator
MKRPQEIILAVDDKPENLSLLFDLLDGKGYEVLVSQNGESAVERAQATQPDLILLDVMMPGIDGFETCRRLKAMRATQTIPVIFMTAVTDTDEKLKGFELGAVDYITKPIQAKEVLARVHTHLTIQRLQQEMKAALQREAEQKRRLTTFTSTTSSILGTVLNSMSFSLDALQRNHDRMTHDERARAITKLAENRQKAIGKIQELLAVLKEQ